MVLRGESGVRVVCWRSQGLEVGCGGKRRDGLKDRKGVERFGA